MKQETPDLKAPLVKLLTEQDRKDWLRCLRASAVAPWIPEQLASWTDELYLEYRKRCDVG